MATDVFLLTVAEVSATLIGLFLVGMIFYMGTGLRRLDRSRDMIEGYFRASTRIVLVLYSIPLGLSLLLVSLPVGWSRAYFLLTAIVLVPANVSTAGGVRPLARSTGANTLVVNEIVGTIGVVVMVILPIATGGLHPVREDLIPVVLLGLGLGFLSTCVLVMVLFDVSNDDVGMDGCEPPLRSGSRGRPRHAIEHPPDQDGEP